MAPAKTSTRHSSKASKTPRQRPARSAQNGKEKEPQQQAVRLVLNNPEPEVETPPEGDYAPIFIDPLFGTPLAIYVEKDVDGRDAIVETINKYGGTVSQAYSAVTYILVDPYKESGQNLYRQYAGKKNKIVLNAQWAYKCVSAGTLQGFNVDWAGCKVTGKEPVGNPPPEGHPLPQASVHAPVPYVSDATLAPSSSSIPNAPTAGPSNAPLPVRNDIANRGPIIHPSMNPTPYYSPSVHPGLEPPVYRPPPAGPAPGHHEYAPVHHYALPIPSVQDPAVHQLPPHGPPAPQVSQNSQQYAPPAQQPVVEAPAIASPSQRTTRPRRAKRNEQLAGSASSAVPSSGVLPVQTVNGHPMPVTASSIDPLDPLARAYASQQDEERQRQEEERVRREEDERRLRNDDDRPHHQDNDRHRHEESQQQQQQPPGYHYPGYQPMHSEQHPPLPDAPPQSWHGSGAIAPQQTHIAAPPMYAPPPHEYHIWPPSYRPPDGMVQPQAPPPGVPPPSQPSAQPQQPGQPPAQPAYDYRYSRDVRPWEGAEYYPPQQQSYGNYYPQQQPPQREPDVPEAGPSTTPDSQPLGHATGAQPRGRKRQRAQMPQPAPPASTLVANRRNPPARSPTPPSRVIKSTYGGNLFTSDDIMYLKKYIDYVQEQGLVLSLREICERIAVKAPHHTFYSWRRYCNKHQIRLGGYHMDIEEELPGNEEEGGDPEHEPAMEVDQVPVTPIQATTSGVSPETIVAAQRIARTEMHRTRSPTPPRALFRSTTGKGVAFTEEDVTFLVRFLEYRNRQHDGKVDMVLFWKEVAAKAPHHSRASWMKFYRRHKHELEHTDADAPLPAKPEKKMRYSKADDALLAHYFATKPEGTSDRIFQEFARMHPHHPWKGWQEHHRIHKAKIDHLISKLANGESIDDEGNEE